MKKKPKEIDLTTLNLRPFTHMAVLLAITAAVGLFSGIRMSQRGQWLPEVPTEIGAWTGVDVPLESATVKTLGDPKTLGRQYKNPFDETVDAHVVSTETFEAYHEPAMCTSGYGFTQTAQLFTPAFGKNNEARAMVLKHEATGIRILMLYWVQYEDGTTTGMGDTPAFDSPARRFQVGLNTVGSGKQAVIVRVYTRIAPGDVTGAQARRNLYEVSRGLYEGIKKDGKVWRQREKRLAIEEGSTSGNVS